MARKRQRNYKAEYQRRIERGKRLGLTRKEARGHAGDLTKSQREAGALAVRRGVELNRVSALLGQLGENRRAKVLVTFSDGTYMTLVGKKDTQGGQRPSSAKKRIDELIGEYGDLETAALSSFYTPKGDDVTVSSINVVYV